MPARAPRSPNFAILLGAAWLLVVLELLIQNWTDTALTLADSDDAMRLVELRAFLSAQGWFSLHEARVAPPGGYDPHWSRLIDAGLAGLFLIFKQFVNGPLAERLMRVVWPLLWLLPAMAATAAAAWRIAGREAALATLIMTVVGLPLLHQFIPGRIDHHNVQITLAALTIAATAWSDRVRWGAAAAGALTGLAMAVGFEALAFLIVCGIALALRYVGDRGAAPALAQYGAALAASCAIAFAIVVAPVHWTATACDSIAINSALAVVAAGLLLAFAAVAMPDETMVARLVVVAGIGCASTALAIALEPRCLGGPYAMMDPAVWPIWLAHVKEMQSLATLARNAPATAAAVIAFPAAAGVAVFALGRDGELRRNFGYLIVAAELAVALALTVGTIKMCSYALWFGMPAVAAVALRLCAWARLETAAARMLAAILLAPAVLSGGAIAVVHAAVEQPAVDAAADRSACFKNESYGPLARLPAGLIATDIDYGPFMLALTPHSVMAAPYHRLSAAIIANYRVFTASPDEARRILDAHGVDYLVSCGGAPPSDLRPHERDKGLWAGLAAGNPPEWLEKLPTSDGDAFTVYRVRRRGADQP